MLGRYTKTLVTEYAETAFSNRDTHAPEEYAALLWERHCAGENKAEIATAFWREYKRILDVHAEYTRRQADREQRLKDDAAWFKSYFDNLKQS